MISKKALQEFKTILEEELGSQISDELAMEQAIGLLTLFDAVYRPVKKDWVKEVDENEDLS